MRSSTIAAGLSALAALTMVASLPIPNFPQPPTLAGDAIDSIQLPQSAVPGITTTTSQNGHHTMIFSAPVDHTVTLQRRDMAGNPDVEGEDCIDTHDGLVCERERADSSRITKAEVPQSTSTATTPEKECIETPNGPFCERDVSQPRTTSEPDTPAPRAVQENAGANDDIDEDNCIDTEYGHFCAGDPRLNGNGGSSMGDCKPYMWGC
ncbi:hypothetical protein BDV96DRAFT_673685 [Lophiotrema nucula]|uniref:Uncharacterized protein n=1 Tax=Lophiotrema nucula TaxID=690887 RepID=A0A6A5YLA5_9PLEO|nr:hypothetical protein BDV96DRAFT_673685 [Lophiotrema nucula]